MNHGYAYVDLGSLYIIGLKPIGLLAFWDSLAVGQFLRGSPRGIDLVSSVAMGKVQSRLFPLYEAWMMSCACCSVMSRAMNENGS